MFPLRKALTPQPLILTRVRSFVADGPDTLTYHGCPHRPMVRRDCYLGKLLRVEVSSRCLRSVTIFLRGPRFCRASEKWWPVYHS